ncbi:TetR/AcrR family transcriptional regulator [Alicyclobacillus fodiniaquatilis]|uniref:TetR/AcrR family transcriptional regulator n=1 Tax=Alicyclobacillus fodiniaquatilis TaxID=1661150 RepID=A0ABW4JNI6_9BACL
MSRPREFDVERALYQCMEVFWTKGYQSTSFEDLTSATGVKKQSLYCVCDGKRDLFLKALRLYKQRNINMLTEIVSQHESPLEKLERILETILNQCDEPIRKGCLMVNAALEFGTGDEDVTHEVKRMIIEMERILEEVIRDGQEQSLITIRQTSQALAAYLNNVLIGAKMMERSGASPQQIKALLRTSIALMLP